MAYDGSCRGVVERVAAGKAAVVVSDTEACHSCGGEGTCAFGGRRKGRTLWVLDPLGVRPGDRVQVEISDEGLLVASLVLYGVPLAGLLVGALVGQWTGGERRSFIGAGIGVLLSLPLVRLLGNRIPARARFSAKIVGVEAHASHP